jgi:hypothetical protein
MKASGDLVIARDRVIEESTASAAFSVPPCLRGENLATFLSAPPRLRGEIGFSDHPISRSRAITRSLVLLTRFLQILRASLREIFDESAYDRFLLRTKSPRSVASYRDFMGERDAAMLKKPRCC